MWQHLSIEGTSCLLLKSVSKFSQIPMSDLGSRKVDQREYVREQGIRYSSVKSEM
jgi:hypothetical protein